MTRFIKKGDLVEYTWEDQKVYTIGDPALAQYAVAVETVPIDKVGPLRVKTDDKSVFHIPVEYIHAFAWGGWVPKNCEKTYEEVSREIEREEHPDPNDPYWEIEYGH